ncbi:MAG: hypothetical protein BMS9Abin02_0118 [Anaerolineae bacterium]|nr:MAG: hypothetical protein BMS9Abin02_0118 [Anaerolineae bacterium]
MAVPLQIVSGRTVIDDDRALILLDDSGEVYLRFALVELNSGAHVFPESILDDWGKEIRNFQIYRWLGENGIYFPRAELFGYGPDDKPVQKFIRELDLTRRFPCYVYLNRSDPLSKGIIISDGVMETSGFPGPILIPNPENLSGLLKDAAIRWWSADCADDNQVASIVNSSIPSENQ